MRIIKFIFISLLSFVLIAATAVFILFQTFDTDQFLPQITKKLTLALGRQVSITGVGLGLSSRGITLDAGPLTVADDAAFTTQPFIQVDRIRVSVDLKSLILQHKIQIRNILIQSPEIHFIRSQEGGFNVSSIFGKGIQTVGNNIMAKAPSVSSREVKSSEATKQSLNPSDNTIKSITIQDAAISFIDQSQEAPKDVWLLNINARVNDFSPDKPFELSFEGSPLVFKSISPDQPDNPVFKRVMGKAGISDSKLTSAEVTISEGVIKNFNILRQVLSHVPVSMGGIDEYIDKLGMDDTVIHVVEAKVTVHDKAFSIDDLLLSTNIFEFTAQGSMDQGFNMDMQTSLHLNADISAALVSQFGGLKYFCDDSKRITLGGSLKGVMPHLKYKPNKDFKKKSKKAFHALFGQLFGA